MILKDKSLLGVRRRVIGENQRIKSFNGTPSARDKDWKKIARDLTSSS